MAQELARSMGQASLEKLLDDASIIVVSTPWLKRESPEMAARIMQLATTALDERDKSLSGSRVLLVGVVTVHLRDLLREHGAIVIYHNPLGNSDYPHERRNIFADAADPQRHMRRGVDGLEKISLTEEELARTDLVVILTAHPGIDRGLIARKADIVIDARHSIGDELRWSEMEVAVRS